MAVDESKLQLVRLIFGSRPRQQITANRIIPGECHIASRRSDILKPLGTLRHTPNVLFTAIRGSCCRLGGFPIEAVQC